MADAPRILHSADWQLGMTRHFLDDEAQARFASDRLAAVERLCEIAGEEHCAGVVVAGDVFETNLVGERVVAPVLEVLSESPVPVLLLPGNHDPLDATSVYTRRSFVAQRPPNVFVLDSDDPVDLDGVEAVMDRRGHDARDTLLVATVTAWSRHLRWAGYPHETARSLIVPRGNLRRCAVDHRQRPSKWPGTRNRRSGPTPSRRHTGGAPARGPAGGVTPTRWCPAAST
jgi:hypothetical protein